MFQTHLRHRLIRLIKLIVNSAFTGREESESATVKHESS
jgi:hypothetical protein